MSLDNNQIILKVNEYFNIALKNKFHFPEIYSLTFEPNIKRITLKSNLPNSKLIELIKNDDKLRSKIEQTLLNGFRTKDPNISNINLYTFNDNEIIITFSYNETPFTLNEIGILARLAAEYDTYFVDRICTLNSNFARACKDNTFWWELIKVKYPQYYKTKKEMKYKGHNPKEVVRGLDYYESYNKTLSEIRSQLMKISDPVDRNAKRKLITERITYFFNNYLPTLKYLILENLWQIDLRYIDLILRLSFDVGDIELMKHLIITYNNPQEDIFKIFLSLLFSSPNNLIVEKFKLLEGLDDRLVTAGKERFFIPGEIRAILGYEISNGNGNDNPAFYEYLSNKLNRPKTNERYLTDYANSYPDNVKIPEYILTQLSKDIDKELLLTTLRHFIDFGEFYPFRILYNFFRDKWTEEDKQILLEKIDEIYYEDDEDRDEFRNVIN